MKQKFTSPQSELEYIDKTMQDMFTTHGHLAMVFDYFFEETLRLLEDKGYSIKLKKAGDARQVTVTNGSRQAGKK